MAGRRKKAGALLSCSGACIPLDSGQVKANDTGYDGGQGHNLDRVHAFTEIQDPDHRNQRCTKTGPDRVGYTEIYP